MKKATFIIMIACIISLQNVFLKADIKNELRQLTNRLKSLEAQLLNEAPPPVPPREDVPDFTPPPLPPRPPLPSEIKKEPQNKPAEKTEEEIQEFLKGKTKGEKKVPAWVRILKQKESPKTRPSSEYPSPTEASLTRESRPQSTPPQPSRITTGNIEAPQGTSLLMRRFIMQANDILKTKSKEDAKRLLNTLNSLQNLTSTDNEVREILIKALKNI